MTPTVGRWLWVAHSLASSNQSYSSNTFLRSGFAPMAGKSKPSAVPSTSSPSLIPSPSVSGFDGSVPVSLASLNTPVFVSTSSTRPSPSESIGAALQTPLMQELLWQSESDWHVWPIAQSAQEPPQSTSVSSPSRVPLAQVPAPLITKLPCSQSTVAV